MDKGVEMLKYYTAVIFIVGFAMLVLQFCIGESNTLSKDRKKLFAGLFFAIMIAALCEWLSTFLDGAQGNTRALHIASKAIELGVAPSTGFIFSWILDKKYVKEITIGLILHFILECMSGVFGFIWYIDANNMYCHGSFYIIYILSYIVSVIYAMVVISENIRKYQYTGTKFFFLIAALLLSGILIQLLDSSIKVSYISLGMAALMLYIFTLEMVQQTDELTELLNRRGYENCIATLEQKSIVVFFDVDKFKYANDTYGHAFGDKALKEIGTAIKTNYSRYGKCCRYGGDEFCVVLIKELEHIEGLNTRFFQEMEKLRDVDERMPSVSIGYAFYDPGTQNIQDVISEADEMMYKYKQTRKQAEDK